MFSNKADVRRWRLCHHQLRCPACLAPGARQWLALPDQSEALEADVHVTLCMYDVIKDTVVRDLRLWVSSTGIRLKDEVSGRAGGCG
jgi:hypothetical protein